MRGMFLSFVFVYLLPLSGCYYITDVDYLLGFRGTEVGFLAGEIYFKMLWKNCESCCWFRHVYLLFCSSLCPSAWINL